MKIKIKDIKVDSRFRDDYGDIESLSVSIQRYGLLHPIVLGEGNILVAGERRLKAHEILGKIDIEATLLKDVDELTRREIEIEENIRRKNFTWQEEVVSKLELDKIKRKMYGSTIPGHGGGWGQRDTAESLGTSVASVSQDLTLAKAIKEFPELHKEKTKSSAFKRFQRIRERLAREELSDRVDVKVDSSSIVRGDCLNIMKTMKSGMIDLIVTDPPYGVDIGGVTEAKPGSSWDKVYGDDAYKIMDMCNRAFKECFRLIKDDRHMYVFFGMRFYKEIYKSLIEAGFVVSEIPIIWSKGSPSTPGKGRNWGYSYEPCFYCQKGKRVLNTYLSDVLEIKRVPANQKIHPTEKPTALLRKLIEISSHPGEVVFDPFSGSGAVVAAAYESNRKGMGVELDKSYWQAATERINLIGKEEK